MKKSILLAVAIAVSGTLFAQKDSLNAVINVENDYTPVVTKANKKGFTPQTEQTTDNTPLELEFSQKYACEEHGISFGELEPKDFSFNNPSGACQRCAGLGSMSTISVAKIIPDKSLSLSEGGIAVNGFKSLTADDGWNGPLIAAVGEKYGFTMLMWSDMFFRMAGEHLPGFGDYDVRVEFTDEVIEKVPYRYAKEFKGNVINNGKTEEKTVAMR